ncbi:Alpha/Beta hydrolase protein [Haematococcus lacustris]
MRGPVLPQRPSRARTRPDQRGSTAAAGAAGAGFAAALWYWATEACSKPLELWCGEGDLKSKVLPLCSCLLQPFRPSPWALNNHVQNIFGFLRTATIRNEYRRQLVIAHDGGTLALDWWSGCDSHAYGTATTPVLLVLHGINGGSQEGYCKWMCEAARSRGWRAVVLNYRGCSGLPLTSPRGYAATLTHDVHYAITSIKARFPAAPLFAVGYSLGGVFLTKYLSEADRGLHASLAAASSAFKPFEGSGLVATAVVSTPVCLFNSSQNLSKPWTAGYLYNMALAYKLREFMVEHRAAITAHTSLNVDKAMQHWEMGAIEDEGIPHTFGFSNRQEYYEASNSLQYIPFIRTPTLFLVSKDDPFLGVLPDEECSANPHTLLAATARGGHVAFLEGLWPLGPAFMDRAVLQFLEVAWSQLPAVAQAAMQLPPELLPPEAQAVGLGVGHGAGASHEEAAGEGGEAHGMSESGRASSWLHTENPFVVSQFKLPPLPRWEGAYQQQQELQQRQQQQACEHFSCCPRP